MPRLLSQRGLHAFQLTVLTGSVSVAADTLGRSQPAASRLLKELEIEVGFRLFDRVKGRLQPTAEGRLLFEEVQRSLLGLDRIAAVAGEIRQGRRGTLPVGAMPASLPLVTRAIHLFAAARPGTAVALHALPSDAVVQMLLTGGCALGFVMAETVTPGLGAVRRYEVPCVVILPPGHALAGRQLVVPADLGGEAFVALSPRTGIGKEVEAVLDAHGVERLTAVETNLTHVASDLVMTGLGLAVVDALTGEAHRAKGGGVVPFAPTTLFVVRAVHPVGLPVSGPVGTLLDCCDGVFGSLSAEGGAGSPHKENA